MLFEAERVRGSSSAGRSLMVAGNKEEGREGEENSVVGWSPTRAWHGVVTRDAN